MNLGGLACTGDRVRLECPGRAREEKPQKQFSGDKNFRFSPNRDSETLLADKEGHNEQSPDRVWPGLHVLKRCTTSDAPTRPLFLPPAETLVSALVFENPWLWGRQPNCSLGCRRGGLNWLGCRTSFGSNQSSHPDNLSDGSLSFGPG